MKSAANMNAYLSDLAVFYLKLHDLHWNVKGLQFVPVHQYCEARYEDMACLKGKAEALRLDADAEGLFDIVAALEDHIAGYNKELWFLRSMMG